MTVPTESVTVTVKLPWDLEELGFPDIKPHLPVEDALPHLRWLLETNSPTNTEELDRVFTATVLLRARFPHVSFSHCLAQAIVWERG
jgi:hypothetical protein